jgi:HK97 family phage prohead protease
MSIERRTANEGVEFREDGDSVTAIGYAAVFNSTSSNLGGFVERVAPGAFRKTLQESDVRALFNHEPDHLLGRTMNGSLRLEEDDRGLRYEVDLPNTTLGRDVAELLRTGILSQSSFGFRTISDSWGETDDGYPLRYLNEVALRDVGPVSFPAYQAAEASLRSLAEAQDLPVEQVVKAAEADNLQSILHNDEPVETDSEPDEIHSVGLPASAFIR